MHEYECPYCKTIMKSMNYHGVLRPAILKHQASCEYIKQHLIKGSPTGRIKSESPNIQNVPIRTEEGDILRETFINSVYLHSVHDEDVYTKPSDDTVSGGGGDFGGGGASGSWD